MNYILSKFYTFFFCLAIDLRKIESLDWNFLFLSDAVLWLARQYSYTQQHHLLTDILEAVYMHEWVVNAGFVRCLFLLSLSLQLYVEQNSSSISLLFITTPLEQFLLDRWYLDTFNIILYRYDQKVIFLLFCFIGCHHLYLSLHHPAFNFGRNCIG